jgi:hypothetical protein
MMNGTCCPIAGCCRLDLPKAVRFTQSFFNQLYNTSHILKTNPCSYITVMESKAFNFSTTYLTSAAFYDTNNATVPVIMDWGIAKTRCKHTQNIKNVTYACVSSKSECIDTDAGYACRCSDGDKGKPYLVNGCKGSSLCPIFYYSFSMQRLAPLFFLI